MMARIGRVLAAALCASLLLAASCGGRARVDGTDSNTHWLRECESDSQCGPLSCICGVCTSACDEAQNCSPFGAKASCEVPAGCDARGPTACVLPSLPSGGGSGGSAGNTGSSGAGTVGGTSPGPDCAAMDAHDSGDDCLTTTGYAWNGNNCEAIICGCQGSDCDAIFATADDCDHAYRGCYEARQVRRACTEHADCRLQARRCCASCIALGTAGDDLIATSVDSSSLRDAGVCLGDPEASCDPCAPHEFPAAYAACVEGECRLLDVSANAACKADEDCHLATKDCCACGGDFSNSGLVSVNAAYSVHPYCPADQGCPECEGDAPSRYTRPTCDTGQGICRIAIIPF